MIPFGPWEPDRPSWNSQATRNVLNVLPARDGWAPFPGAVTFGEPLLNEARGAIAVRKNDRTYDFYVGTEDAIYKFNNLTDDWDDVSKAGGYSLPADDDWGFAQFGSLLIAVNRNSVPQVIDIEAGTLFGDLDGSPPTAGGVVVFGDFVVLFNLLDDPATIRWSDINDAESWTASTASLAGSQTFPDGGYVTAVTSANTGYVFQEGCVRRMVFVGGSVSISNTPLVFQFEKAVADMGLRSPLAYTERGQQVFFLAEDGFYSLSAAGLKNLSVDRVSKTFFDDIETTEFWRVRASTDFVHPRVYWAYPSDTGSGAIDKVIGYDFSLDRWFPVEQTIQSWLRGATQGTTLEDLDALFATLEDVTPSLDSHTWEGGTPVLGVFNANNQLAFFTGDPKEATIDTPEVQLNTPNRAQATLLHPAVDTSGAFFRVGTRERLANSVTFKPEVQMTATGRVPVRGSGRYHRFRMRIPAGTSWTHATGIGADFVSDGVR